MKPYIQIILSITLCIVGLATALPAFAQEGTLPQDLIKQVGFDQKLGDTVPLDVEFVNADGQKIRLGDQLRDKPVILSLGYYECPMLCSLVRNGLLASLQNLEGFDVGNQFDVIFLSIDPDETPEMAAETKEISMAEYMRTADEAGWQFWVGEESQIRQLTDAVGFRYVYDPAIDEYVHPSGIVILSPDGEVARYFYGLDYPPRDLRLGLIEAASNKISSPVDQFLLICYHYDPLVGQYTLSIMALIRFAGVMTVLAILGFVAFMLFNERRQVALPSS
jgi:protein SCO1/2